MGFFLWMKSYSFSSLGAVALANFLFLFNAAWLKRLADLIKKKWYKQNGLLVLLINCNAESQFTVLYLVAEF